ncbi:alkaline phosphatase family protein [Mucilaginibacter arboris]|uniref:Alkaline phosphatase family protein n=1 Tax=Mucilaginibacter arboris TaxID=2682090 RepID=A0A7K1SW78_9SPHI|nr:ectonucleotide pyrophosphatase/phosphodiesterase [Mucilaginibacter arboris]MVN21554.1 alkaline phosphatase family protein [Mucilaginibacter arboris]
MKRFFAILIFCFLSTFAFAQADTTQHVISGRKNSIQQQKKTYVIMISVDGLRYDFVDKYQAKNLMAFRTAGVQAERMVPSYPSLTFPNHYTLVTGLYPAHHGLVNNDFYDPKRKEFYKSSNKAKAEDGKWYGGTPLWVLAEQQKILTASFYWVGSEAPIKGIYPTYYYDYSEKIGIHQRIETVVNWLKLPAEKRPHLITFYFPEVDHAAHNFGPDAAETQRAVLFIDSAVNELNKAVKATGLPVSFILVSDHGMVKVDTQNPIPLPQAVDTTKFIIPPGGEILELYAKNKKHIPATYQSLKQSEHDYKVYTKANLPAYLHYGEKDDRYNRIGDILLIPDLPKVFRLGPGKIKPGQHGYDPTKVKEMNATFYAWGPAFKQHLKIPAFQNINVYPVVTTVLGLKQTEKIDGNTTLAKQIIRK